MKTTRRGLIIWWWLHGPSVRRIGVLLVVFLTLSAFMLLPPRIAAITGGGMMLVGLSICLWANWQLRKLRREG